MEKRLLLSVALSAGLLVGTFDILAAFIHFYIKTKKNPVIVLEYISSAVFGKSAYSGDTFYIASGLIFHYGITIGFTILFFWLVTQIPSLLKYKFFTGVMYGIFMWVVMAFIVIPLSTIPPAPFNLQNAIISILILIACIGIPLCFIAGKKQPAN